MGGGMGCSSKAAPISLAVSLYGIVVNPPWPQRNPLCSVLLWQQAARKNRGTSEGDPKHEQCRTSRLERPSMVDWSSTTLAQMVSTDESMTVVEYPPFEPIGAIRLSEEVCRAGERRCEG